MNLTLLKYLKSFSDGRIRIRHPALRKAEISALTQKKMKETYGVNQVETNTLSGSILILYDCTILSKDRLIEMGTAWANYLDQVNRGLAVAPPEFV